MSPLDASSATSSLMTAARFAVSGPFGSSPHARPPPSFQRLACCFFRHVRSCSTYEGRRPIGRALSIEAGHDELLNPPDGALKPPKRELLGDYTPEQLIRRSRGKCFLSAMPQVSRSRTVNGSPLSHSPHSHRSHGTTVAVHRLMSRRSRCRSNSRRFRHREFSAAALGLPRHFHARWRLVRRRLLLLLSLLLLQVFGLRFLRLRGRLRCGLAFGLRLLFPLL